MTTLISAFNWVTNSVARVQWVLSVLLLVLTVLTYSNYSNDLTAIPVGLKFLFSVLIVGVVGIIIAYYEDLGYYGWGFSLTIAIAAIFLIAAGNPTSYSV